MQADAPGGGLRAERVVADETIAREGIVLIGQVAAPDGQFGAAAKVQRGAGIHQRDAILTPVSPAFGVEIVGALILGVDLDRGAPVCAGLEGALP